MHSQIPGWVHIEGASNLSYENPLLFISGDKLSLSRPDLSDSNGAEIDIFSIGMNLLLYMMPHARKNLEFQATGAALGTLDQVRGHPVSDVGSMTHPITSFDASMKFENNRTLFSISGTIGTALPWTCHNGMGGFEKSTHNFQASLVVSDDNLFLCTSNHTASKFMHYRDMYICNAKS